MLWLETPAWRYGLVFATLWMIALSLWRAAINDPWSWQEFALWSLLIFGAGTLTAVARRNARDQPRHPREPGPGDDPLNEDDGRRWRADRP